MGGDLPAGSISNMEVEFQPKEEKIELLKINDSDGVF